MAKKKTPLRLKEIREGGVTLTQKEVAKLVDLDHTTVAHHENGTRNPTAGDLKKYAEVFKCATHELFNDLPIS